MPTDRYKNLFLKTNNIERSSYVWNMIAGLLFAMQSALVLIVMTRTNGLEDSGIFSIAYAVASLMSFIGEYGVRKFQVSDVNEEFDFTEYFTFRILSCSVMILASIVYVSFTAVTGGYSTEKFLIILIVCLVKLVESFNDVFYGRYQQKGRLDVAAKTNSFRIAIGMIVLMGFLVLTQNLLISVAAWFISVVLAMFASTIVVAKGFAEMKINISKDMVKKLVIACFPLFIGSFLLIYVGNAPKYAIDACMNDEAQACFNFIFMPVFVINLLANFVFNPVLVKLSESWNARDYRLFRKMTLKQVGVIGGLTLLAIAVALTIGCPVLGWLYNTDLSSYRAELTILMVGGGMLAAVNFFTIVVTVIRCQKHLIIGYVACAVLAGVFSNHVVADYGIMGASVLYSLLMTLMGGVFAIILVVCVKKRKGD